MVIRSKDIMKIFMIILYLIFTVSGLILMKKGGNAGKITIGAGELGFSISWISALGFICYIISFLLFTRIIMMFENVSYISPICNGIAQACIVIASIIFLKEQFSIATIGGALLIIVGVVVMNLKV
jgi:multidrug transporter EmrE-like cation transporter